MQHHTYEAYQATVQSRINSYKVSRKIIKLLEEVQALPSQLVSDEQVCPDCALRFSEEASRIVLQRAVREIRRGANS
jgi:hypothetical protein